MPRCPLVPKTDPLVGVVHVGLPLVIFLFELRHVDPQFLRGRLARQGRDSHGISFAFRSVSTHSQHCTLHRGRVGPASLQARPTIDTPPAAHTRDCTKSGRHFPAFASAPRIARPTPVSHKRCSRLTVVDAAAVRVLKTDSVKTGGDARRLGDRRIEKALLSDRREQVRFAFAQRSAKIRTTRRADESEIVFRRGPRGLAPYGGGHRPLTRSAAPRAPLFVEDAERPHWGAPIKARTVGTGMRSNGFKRSDTTPTTDRPASPCRTHNGTRRQAKGANGFALAIERAKKQCLKRTVDHASRVWIIVPKPHHGWLSCGAT